MKRSIIEKKTPCYTVKQNKWNGNEQINVLVWPPLKAFCSEKQFHYGCSEYGGVNTELYLNWLLIQPKVEMV